MNTGNVLRDTTPLDRDEPTDWTETFGEHCGAAEDHVRAGLLVLAARELEAALRLLRRRQADEEG